MLNIGISMKGGIIRKMSSNHLTSIFVCIYPNKAPITTAADDKF